MSAKGGGAILGALSDEARTGTAVDNPWASDIEIVKVFEAADGG
jgi:hypothetical protein